MGSLRIFIASPDESLRLALIMFLDDQPSMVVVGIADRLPGLLIQLKGADADVLLLDWESPVQSVIDLLTKLNSFTQRPKTIVFSSKAENKKSIKAAGVDYFIAKDSPPDKLLPILKDIKLSKDKLKT